MMMNRPNSGVKSSRKARREQRRVGKARRSNSRPRWAFGEVLEDRRMLTTDFGQIATALNAQLLGMQSQLTSTLNNYHSGPQSSIPLVGDSLGSASQIVDRFDTELRSALTNLGTLTNPTDSVIQQALAAVPLLADRNGNGVGPSDVLITRPGNLGSEGFAVQMRLQAAPTLAATTVSFDSGLPSLPLSVEASGTVDVSVGFAYELAFTYNSGNQQVALDSSKTLAGLGVVPPSPNHPLVDLAHPLAVFVSAGLHEGFSARATLGFVQGTAAPIAGQANALYLTAMVNNLSGAPAIKLDGGADANLRLTGSFSGTNEDFPAIDADFHLHWSFSSSNPTANPPQVMIDNVALDLGKFLSNVLKPVFEVIQTTTAPMQPLEELFRYPLPVLTDLSNLIGGGSVTLLDIADIVAPYTDYGPLFDLIHSMSDLIYSINQIDLSASLKMPLGGFDLNSYDLRTVPSAGDVHNLSLQNLTEFVITNAQATNLPVPTEASQFLQKLVDAMSNGYEIAFPILDDPKAAIFGMLVGRDADLFTFTADYTFNSQGSSLPSFSVYGMGVKFEGDVHMDAHFKFAYDTYGLRQLVNHLADGNTSDIGGDIIAGFYIADDSHFSLSGGLVAGVGASVAIFSVTLGGFVTTDNEGQDPVSITINDPNHDGKLRFAEFSGGGLHTSGRFVAALGVEVAIGFEEPFFGEFIGVKKRFDIASTVIVDLNVPDPQAPPIPIGPILASQPDAGGNIELYIGESAHLRQEVSQINGDDKIVIRNIETTDLGETIEIALRQEFVFGDLPPVEYWVTQTITGVHSISGYGDLGNLVIDVLPGVNVDVHFEGGEGTTDLMYNGAGSAYLKAGLGDGYLIGGQGGNVLLGGPANDKLVLGPGGNFVSGSTGDNTFVIITPLTDSGVIFGGSDEGNNTFIVLAGENTQWISAMPGANGAIELNYQLAEAPPSPGLTLLQFSTLVVSAQDRATDITIGDLSPAGVSRVIVSNPTIGDGGRNIVLDTKAGGGTSQITVAPFLHSYFDTQDPDHPVLVQTNELEVANATTGVTTYLLGMKDADRTTIRQHGGSAQIGQLSKNEGELAFDFSSRPAGTVQTVLMTTPALDHGNQIATGRNAAGQFLVSAVNYPALTFQGLAPIDSMTMNVAAPVQNGGNTVDLDAFAFRGSLVINALGSATAVNHVTVSHVHQQASVALHGGATTTKLQLGTGRLADIQSNVTASNIALAVDNSLAPLGSLLSVRGSTFGSWLIPGSAAMPHLTFSGLRGALEIFAGAGDRYQLDATPAGITSLSMHNTTTTLDPVYTADWTVPVALQGNFSFYAGRRLVADDLDHEQVATVERVRRLSDVAVPVTLDFVGAAASEVILDGDLDPAGAQYTIDGNGNLHLANLALGLDVTINGYRNHDQLYVYMPGASVAANLQRTSPGAIYLDGAARLAGLNPTAANTVTIEARYGQTEMVPTGDHNSLLDMFNDVYLLGSMAQDSLVINVPTNVRITPNQSAVMSLNSNSNTWAEVNASYPDALTAWKQGPGNVFTPFGPFTPFGFGNLDLEFWWDSFNPWPNPFVEFAYGIDVPHVDAPLSVTYFSQSGSVVTSTVLSGIGRYFFVDSQPVAVDNDVQLDASQLRGSFQFHITGPDYDYIEDLARNSFQAFPTSYTYNGFHTWGSQYDNMRIAFGQSNVVLSHVNPELSVQITSENKEFAYPEGTFPPNAGPPQQVVVSDYPVTSLNVGAGILANIQGNVAVQKVQLTADDSAGSAANNLILTASMLSGWSTAAGLTNALLTMSTLEQRPLTLLGGSLDRFGVEGTPSTAGTTTIRNLTTTGSPAAVYVMGKTPNQALDVIGNFDLYIGHRLNAGGSVTSVGQVAGVLAIASNRLTARPIGYDFTGQGQGHLVYDASHHIAGEFASQSQAAVVPDSGNPDQEQFLFDQSYNAVVYGANTDIDFYGPTIAAQTFSPSSARLSLLVDHRLPGTFRYFAGPTVPPHIVRVMAAYGPVLIEGQGALTRAEIDPASVTINQFDGSSPAVFNSPGSDLQDTILADVTVTNTHLTIRPDFAGAPTPAVPKHVVVSNTQVTGIAGAAIHYANLRDIVTSGSTAPGLLVQMPRHAASLTINDTPLSAVTGIHVIGPSLAEVRVLGTTGRLALGSLAELNQNPNDFRLPASGQSITFAAQSLTIGDGSVQYLHGEVMLGRLGTFTTTLGTVIDNRSDPLPREVGFYVASTDNFPVLDGLAPAPIRMRQLPSGLSIYGSPDSHITARGLDNALAQAVSLYAGAGSSVDLLEPTNGFGTFNVVPALRVLGAETVRFVAPGSLQLTASSLIRIEADPARPADVTELIADYSALFGVNLADALPPSFVTSVVHLLEITSGDTGLVSLGNATFTPHFEFQSDTTHLTLLGSNRNDSPKEIRVTDAGPGGTVIHPGRQAVKVLATHGPVEIHQAVTQSFGTAPFSVVLGNAGNMQAIQGQVTIIGENATLPIIPLELNSAADGAARTVAISNPAANHWALTGLAPATIHIVGERVATSLLGGSGNNSLVGPDSQNLWQINANNGGQLNGRLTYSGFANLVGGDLGDEFLVQQGGIVGGNLNGGPEYDVIRYDAHVLPEVNTIDLPAGIVPLVSGMVTNVEAVVAPFALLSVSNRSSVAGTTIVPFKVQGSGGLASLVFSAVGLPPSLAIDAQTGFISGTVSPEGAGSSPYQVTVSATDGISTAMTDFSWSIAPSFSLINPGTLLAPEGVPMNLLLHADNPTNRSLTFYAGGSIPSYLYLVQIDENTAALRGTVYFYGGTYLWPVTVYATDRTSTVSTTFNIQSMPGFGANIPSSLTSYAGTEENLALVNNVYGHAITVSASGLPAGLSMSPGGMISGTIAESAVSGSPYEVLGTVTDATIGYSLPFAFQWTVLPQFPVTVENLRDWTSYVGAELSFTLDAYNPFSHGFSISVSGLPAGIVFDETTRTIGGTVAPAAVGSSPYLVSVIVTDHTLGQVVPASFQWTVLPPLSLAHLNAGTAAGVPWLAHILDPESSPNPSNITPVTYANGAASTVVYFLSNNQIWQYDAPATSPVASIDLERPTINTPFSPMAVPGRGVVFSALGPGGYELWFADQDGARPLSQDSVYPTGRPAVTLDGETYFTVYDTSFWKERLLRLRFAGAGVPILEPIALLEVWGVQALTALAGGVAFSGNPLNDYSSSALYWFDPTTDTVRTLASSPFSPVFSDLTVASGPAATENLFFLQSTAGGKELRVFNSVDLTQNDPQPTTLAAFDASVTMGSDVYPLQPLVSVASLITFSVLASGANFENYITQFWTSDGTPGGTRAVGAPYAGYDTVSDQTSFAGAVFFVHRPSTDVAQIWKFDPLAGQLSQVLTSDPSLSDLRAAGDKLYFTRWDDTAGADRLWFITAANFTPTPVAVKAGNPYSSPQLDGAMLAGDSLYFTALASAVVDTFGQPTYQLWVLGPAVPALSSSVVGRHLFYNQSGTASPLRYDGNNPAINANDDLAIATNKVAYLPGTGAATFANVSSYTKGINGIMIDIAGAHGTITAADFIFRVGNNNTPNSWVAAPAPNSISVRAGAGVSGSDRVVLTWANGAISKKWLEVIVLANANTGLSQKAGYPVGQGDVFFFGNAMADSGSGNSATQATVNTTDELAARNHPANVTANISITNLFDFNRDGQVNTTDALASRNHATNAGNVVRLISIANPPASPEARAAVEGEALLFLDIAATEGGDGLPMLGEPIDAGFAFAVAVPAAGETLSDNTAPRWLVNRLQSLDHSIGRTTRYFEHLADQNTPAARKILVASERVADRLGLTDSLLDSLLADLGLG